MRIVLDTNVLVSGLLGLYSYPARIIDMICIGRLQCAYDDRIMTEYREVLSRPRFQTVISEKERQDILDYLARTGIHVVAAPLGKDATVAPDPDDLPFVEVALAAGAEFIVTGNVKHFSYVQDQTWGIRIVSPRDCYGLICT